MTLTSIAKGADLPGRSRIKVNCNRASLGASALPNGLAFYNERFSKSGQQPISATMKYTTSGLADVARTTQRNGSGKAEWDFSRAAACTDLLYFLRGQQE